MTKCECDTHTKVKAPSRIECRPYKAGGLPDIQIPMVISRCICGGEIEKGYPAIGPLHDYLGVALTLADEMRPHHMKFVRKTLGYADPEDFARIAGADPSEVKRVEMGDHSIPHEWHQLLKGLVLSRRGNY